MRRLIEVAMKALALGLLLLGPLPAGPAVKAQVPAERPADKPGDRTPSIAERAKDLAPRDGFLPFYWDARKGQLLVEVSRWNEDFLYGTGLAGGAGHQHTRAQESLGPDTRAHARAKPGYLHATARVLNIVQYYETKTSENQPVKS